MNRTHAFIIASLLAVPITGFAQEESAADKQDIPDAIVEKVDRSVVAIQHERAGGSGFIVSPDGYILTNGHVVRGNDKEDPTRPAESITVILHDEQKFPARVLGFSMDPDVALIKIEPNTPLQPVEFADSTQVHVGQKCFAVGTPVGLKRTFTSGILSNVERSDLNTSTRVFQTDAAINPGNSGGPLFDRNGRVLGINTYATQSANNLGFTIPIHVVLVVRDHLLEYGRFRRADLPVFISTEIYDELARTLEVESGILLSYVMPDSPAYHTGLREGDILIEMDGQPVAAKTRVDLLDFEWDLVTREPGSEMTLAVLRGPAGQRERLEFKVLLEEHEPLPRVGRHSGEIVEQRYDILGLGFKPITRLHRIIHRLPDANGVMVTSSAKTSPSGKADLMGRDILSAVDGIPTPDAASFERELELALAAGRKHIELTRVRGKSTLPTVLTPYYYLKGKVVAMIIPDPEADHLDLLRRELVADGADLRIYYPAFAERPEGGASVAELSGTEADILLLAGGQGGRQLWTDKETLRVIREAEAAEQLLSAVGPSSLALVIAAPDLLEKKITMSKNDSTEAMLRQANYTGEDVESDERIVTTTGFDRATYREFLTVLRRVARNHTRGPDPKPVANR